MSELVNYATRRRRRHHHQQSAGQRPQPRVPDGIASGIQSAAKDPQVKAIVVMAAATIAGADIMNSCHVR